MGLSQSEWIAVAILAGFLIFLAIKGKLANYWSLLTGGAAAGTSASSTSSTATSAVGSVAGAAAGAATGNVTGGALPSGGTSTNSATVSGTITNNGQTATTTFPTIPGTNVPMPQVTI
jgi:hypothetical protein